MAWGILEDTKLAEVPGTTLLDRDYPLASDADNTALKTKKGVVLVPQPSDSPNDPYNWSSIKKNVIITTLSLTSGVTTALGPMISPGLVLASMMYNVSLDQVSTFLIGLFILLTGTGTFFTAAVATVWGKRPVFVISVVILLLTNIWGYFSMNFVSLSAMRIVQGLASAPMETLVTSTVSDIFFVHERGQKLAIWGVMITSGVLLGQVIAGYIIESLGFLATFGVTVIIFRILAPAIFFLVPETAYIKREKDSWEEDEKNIEAKLEVDEPKRPYKSELRVFNGRISDESFWKQVIKPLPLICFPGVVFSTFVYGSFMTWLIVFSVGLTNLPLLAVGLLATPIAGFIADKVARFMARRNKGIYEPEFRLTLMIPATIFSTTGFIGFGLSVAHRAPLVWPLFFMSLHSASVGFASTASFTYVIDCHPKDANQAFVTINFFKAVFAFLASLFVNGWYTASGPKIVFTAIGVINLAVSLLTVPMYIYGKKFRSMVARSPTLNKL
ncbi:hypothetical protein VTN00DRAFT_3495 [Thermoascus crustaceus]|uniref:uncharacterized protein n=1 Tax=Thermoascus crustaceus TaxID=5088 RepID=UPI0037430F2E